MITTNLTHLKEKHLELIKKCKKLYLTVSIYGYNKESYIKNTNRDRYDKFINLFDNKDIIQERLLGLRGGLYIREYPAGQATVNTIHAHLEKCIQQNIEPDLIIVDYADLLTSKSSKEKRDKLDDIYTSLRGLASELKLPIWTASQVNRSGAREEIIQGDRMAESYSKMMITDFAMSLSRSAEDKENGTGRWHIMKNRYGADGITYDSLMDTSIGKIEINMRGNNRPQQTLPGDLNPRERRRLQQASDHFHGM